MQEQQNNALGTLACTFTKWLAACLPRRHENLLLRTCEKSRNVLIVLVDIQEVSRDLLQPHFCVSVCLLLVTEPECEPEGEGTGQLVALILIL